MDNSTADLWVDEEKDDTVDNMLLLISGSKGKVFEKHFWQDKGLIEGPKNMVEEEDGDRSLKRKHSKLTDGNNIDALKTYFISSMEQMTEKVQNEMSTLVDVVVKKFDKLEEGIKGIQQTSKNLETRMDRFEGVIKGVQETGVEHEEVVKENGSQKDTTCSNNPSGKKAKPVRQK